MKPYIAVINKNSSYADEKYRTQIFVYDDATLRIVDKFPLGQRSNVINLNKNNYEFILNELNNMQDDKNSFICELKETYWSVVYAYESGTKAKIYNEEEAKEVPLILFIDELIKQTKQFRDFKSKPRRSQYIKI